MAWESAKRKCVGRGFTSRCTQYVGEDIILPPAYSLEKFQGEICGGGLFACKFILPHVFGSE